MSKIFNTAKKWYDKGLWTEADLQRLVDRGILPVEEFNEIIGDEGNEPESN